MIGGCCSTEVNYMRYGIKGTPSCRSNFITALAHARHGPARHPRQHQLLHERAGAP